MLRLREDMTAQVLVITNTTSGRRLEDKTDSIGLHISYNFQDLESSAAQYPSVVC